MNLTVYVIHGTSRAFCISLVPKEEAPNSKGIWVPKSVVTKRKMVLSCTGEWAKEEWEMTPKCYKQYIHEKACAAYVEKE